MRMPSRVELLRALRSWSVRALLDGHDVAAVKPEVRERLLEGARGPRRQVVRIGVVGRVGQVPVDHVVGRRRVPPPALRQADHELYHRVLGVVLLQRAPAFDDWRRGSDLRPRPHQDAVGGHGDVAAGGGGQGVRRDIRVGGDPRLVGVLDRGDDRQHVAEEAARRVHLDHDRRGVLGLRHRGRFVHQRRRPGSTGTSKSTTMTGRGGSSSNRLVGRRLAAAAAETIAMSETSKTASMKYDRIRGLSPLSFRVGMLKAA